MSNRAFRFTEPLTKAARFRISVVESRHSFAYHGIAPAKFSPARWEFAPAAPAPTEPAPAGESESK